MASRSVTCLSVLGMLVGGRAAVAEPKLEVPVVDVDPVGISVTNETEPQKKSYLFPAVEILTMAIATNAGAQLAGMDWAKISPSTMKTNLTHEPVWDEDPYTIDQLGHPYGGAMLFSAARSSGLGFWMSGLYSFTGSLVWEVLLENEPPSMNDQITTPIGGMFIGEAMHRFSRALLFPGYGKPNLIRRSAAAVIDPVGSINRAWWGDPWVKLAPPRLYAHFGVGVSQPTTRFLGDQAGDTQVHAEFVAEHGIAGDSAFVPRHPMDHFELRGSIAASKDNVDGTLYTRGLALGSGFGGNGIRGLGGLFGAYDFSNKDHIRHSALGFGPGVTAELKVRERGYLQGTAAGYLVPWGAAGGESEEEKMRRDYHHGPGAASVLELKAGQRGLGEVRIASRGYQIMGTMVDEPANETVVTTTVGGRLHLTAHHAIGVEGTYAYRRASFTEGADAGMVLNERTAEVRAFYAITTDEVFGR